MTTVHIKMKSGPGLACGAVKGEWTYPRTEYQMHRRAKMCEDCLNSEEYGMYLLRNMDNDAWKGIDLKVERKKYYGTITGSTRK